MTDLHKGTHNCAAAIRESGAGISSPSLAPPSPAFLHPRSGSQPPPTPSKPPPQGLQRGPRGGQKHGHSVSTLLSFFHTSGRRRRWFLDGTTRLLLSPSPLHPRFPPPPPSFAPRSPQPGRSCSPPHHLPLRASLVLSTFSPLSLSLFSFSFFLFFRILSLF